MPELRDSTEHKEVSQHGGAFLMGRRHLAAPEFYNLVAARYDTNYTSASDRAEDRVLYRWLGPLDGLQVVDVGCGTGALLDHTRPRGYVGIDPSEGMLDVARRKHPRELFLHGDAEWRLAGLSPAAYDRAIAMWSLSYLGPGALPAMRRVLKPGGRLFAVAYSPRYVRRPEFAFRGVTHQARTWTPRQLRRRVEASGFTDVRVRGFRFVEGDSRLPVAARASGTRAASACLPACLALALVIEGTAP